jgi:hypothetical protein
MRFKALLTVLIFGLAIFFFFFSPSKAANLEELEELAAICLQKGNPLEDGSSARFLEKVEKIDNNTERHLYLTVYYIFSGNTVRVAQVDFREEIWTKTPGGTEIPHNYMDEAVFARHKDFERIVERQRIVRDGGIYGNFDGKVDFAGERVVTLTVNRVVIDVTDLPTPSPEEAARLYDCWIKEILEVAGPYDENDESEEPELLQPYKPLI